MKFNTNIVSVWFGLIMILVIMFGAVAISFTNVLSDRLYGNKRIFFVILLLAYAVYRGFRLYSLFKQKQHD